MVVGRYNGFVLAQNNFREWLRVWKMVVPEDYEYKSDLLVFARETKSRFIYLVENEIEALQSVKVSFGLNVGFSIQRNGEMQRMEHYFREKDRHVFRRQNEDGIKIEFDRFVERTKGEFEAWSERGSGWVIEGILEAYVNVARNEPFRGGTYFSLPEKLKNKKAIINIQNKDNQCLRWAIRAALFPAEKGKKTTRPGRYPINDGLNFS